MDHSNLNSYSDSSDSDSHSNSASLSGIFLMSPSTDVMDASLPPNITLTKNSSYTFTSTTSFCLDFYFEVMQNTQPSHIVTVLEAAWKENSSLALKLMFQLRDVRRGKSAKLEFYHCLGWLLKNHPQTLLQNLEHLPLHGYWKDLLFLVQFSVNGNIELITKKQVMEREKDHVLDFANLTLEELICKRANGEISQTAWNSVLDQLSDKNVKKLAEEIHAQRHLEAKDGQSAKKKQVSSRTSNGMQDEKFAQMYKAVERIFVNALKHDVGVLEKKEKLDSTSLAGKWAPTIGGSFDVSTQLGKNIARALLATVREKSVGESDQQFDKEAFCAYQSKYLTPLREAVKKGEKKIASGALLPHQIVKKFMEGGHAEKELEDLAEMQWKSYVDNLKKIGSFENALAMCDASGTGEPTVITIALSLLMSAVSKPPFNGLICSFSFCPELHETTQRTLKEKVQFLKDIYSGRSIGFQATFDLLLEFAIAAKLPRDEMVKTLFVFTGKKFEYANGDFDETDFKQIEIKFAEAGYPLPAIVFWNLRGDSRSEPVTKQQKNVTVVSGFSCQMLQTFLETGQFEYPYETMIETLSIHYDHLKVVD